MRRAEQLRLRYLVMHPGAHVGSGEAATEQAGTPLARAPKGAYMKFIGRFALLLAAVYVILSRSWVPPVAFFAGLFASAAGVVTALVYELVSSGVRQSVGKGL